MDSLASGLGRGASDYGVGAWSLRALGFQGAMWAII